MANRATTVRLNPELQSELELTAVTTGKRKAWIINEALRQYLARQREEAFTAEIRRQSANCAGSPTSDEVIWEALTLKDAWR